jgi:hypothetical protein
MVRARQFKLWFHSGYQDLWFSPDEMQAEWDAGRFIWGPQNWTLEFPEERLARLSRAAEGAQQAVEDFKERLKA